MCGVCGILITQSCECQCEDILSNAMDNLRHRGHDGCGIVVNINSEIYRRRLLSKEGVCSEESLSLDLIPNVIRKSDDFYTKCRCLSSLKQPVAGLVHTRYKTAGKCSLKNTQPLLNHSRTIALVHNGQIKVNEGHDSKRILDIFDEHYHKTNDIFKSIEILKQNIIGSYACILLIKNVGIVGFRDPLGIRPLIFGTNNNNVMFASESIVLTSSNYKVIRDVKPGESIFVNMQGLITFSPKQHIVKYTPCLFEYIYLAHEKSIIDGIQVQRARTIMAELMFDKLKHYLINTKTVIDVLVPIPNTPVLATLHLSALSKIKYVDLLSLPLHLSGRTFILPTQNKREMAVKQKFKINHDRISECKGKTIALVDDSIVRGTTTKILIKMIRQIVQPRKIILISLAPVVRYKNIYGIDIPDQKELIAHNRTLAEIAVQLGADDIFYGDIVKINSSLIKEAYLNGVSVSGFESSVFLNNLK